ncbi:tRNA pseudouridine(38-40) synthase TruA [Hwanghaeella grinnelliae]|uniref:tRNA pseudouridine synthase A n=1 Tax=Hwanghaeella grinnelliae TaxID=2500179 RepID=A0A437QPZ6_9PROT|nr:tRNA pseudouridine(38-40) synthase TruA [Hwanghaeella grinnelliae]RVU36603.1 tRNA pseudouridine(38-40) synthase TruA [Hwanghaeella grinnelliae]
MQRWKLTLEYDGGPYVGWQRQDNGQTVQQRLEEAAEKLCGCETLVQGAGRTDSGVHALAQVAHVDIAKDLRASQVRDALNFHLRPDPISILEAEPVPDDFHARFSAIGRVYLYRILNRRPPPALDSGKVWHNQRPLDAEAMHEAAQALIGNHDFTSFRSTECQADSPVKTMDRVRVRRAGEEIHVDVAARSFLHNQVRIIVGTLELVGRGKWTPHMVKKALDAKSRSAAGPTAPPGGLYLVSVKYPDEEE